MTARAIREVDAEATILAPNFGNRGFLRECFERGMLEHIDVVSVHPYRSRNPETVLPEYVELRNLIQEFSPDREIPIVSGEWGYSVHKYGDVQITEHMQAQYLAREFLVNLMAKIRVSIWYDWKNDGTDPGEREHNFGTVNFDLEPKEAHKAAQTLTSMLYGLRFEKRIESERENDYILQFGNDEKTVLAAWTTGDAHHVSFNSFNINTQATTMLGTKLDIIKEENKIVFPVSQDPIYLNVIK